MVMVNKATPAGIRFDRQQETNRGPSTAKDDLDRLSGDYKTVQSKADETGYTSLYGIFSDSLNAACETGLIHNELEIGRGWAPIHVCKQRVRHLFDSRTLSHSAALKQNLRGISLDANGYKHVNARIVN